MSDLSSLFVIWLVALLLFGGFVILMFAFLRNRNAQGKSFLSRRKEVADEDEISMAPHRLQRIREKNETSDS